jgi:hypothetical protein
LSGVYSKKKQKRDPFLCAKNQRGKLKFKIGVKYCGGCSSKYDRTALVSDIKKLLASKACFVSHEENKTDLILVVAGCRTACVDMTLFKNSKVYIVCSKRDADLFIKKIVEMEEKNGLEKNL